MALPLGVGMMLKAMGIDTADVENFGSQAGAIVRDFSVRLDRIESDLAYIKTLLEKQHGERHESDGHRPIEFGGFP